LTKYETDVHSLVPDVNDNNDNIVIEFFAKCEQSTRFPRLNVLFLLVFMWKLNT